jgi:aldehyde:ferredoxin oxidoreductase
VNGGIEARVERLCRRLADAPSYPGQGAVLFVDLAARAVRRAFLPRSVLTTFLGGRGANMFLLYNLMDETREALDPANPLIFGTGVLTGSVPSATRGNVTGLAPDSDALMDSNAGDYFPTFMRWHGIDHIVLYRRHAQWTLLRIGGTDVEFVDASPYLGLDNIDFTAAVERDFACRERKDMALARITRAGENQVLCAGIMGGPKSIWARGGTGAKMGALRVKGILLLGRGDPAPLDSAFKHRNRSIGAKILGTSVIRNALKTVGTPFLYKPSRTLGAMGTMNNQHTTWDESLDADNFDAYRPGMDGCCKCPVKCRQLNDMTPEGRGGWGAGALHGVRGNASYAVAESELRHERGRTWRGARGDGRFDRYDHGDGPEYVTLGKFGPNLGIREPEQVLRLNNILNDLGLDASSTGGAIAWAMELWQRGLIGPDDTGGLDLAWGNFPVIERLLFQTAAREGFGDTIADSAQAVKRGRYPPEALAYRMAVKGLFQSDPHDARILKAFALGLAVATRGMDHLRNRATLEINARINDDPVFKTALYGGVVAPEPDAYAGKEYAVRRCEDTFAAGDAVGMCRFDTKLFNSPSLPDCGDFAAQAAALTGVPFGERDLLDIGRNISGLERLINARLGLGAADDTLPRRWFDEPCDAGPFRGARVDRAEFERLKQRFYAISGLGPDGRPAPDWHLGLARAATGFAIDVTLPDLPGVNARHLVVDEPVADVGALRALLKSRFPRATACIDDPALRAVVNGEMPLRGEDAYALRDGDRVQFVPQLAGG